MSSFGTAMNVSRNVFYAVCGLIELVEAALTHTCGPNCAGEGLACAIKHCGIAEVYCEEASTRSDPEDCRQRMQHAYDHFSHISDVHLGTSHPKLAKRAREIRKDWEPIIFKRGKACPPHGARERIADFKQELVDALAKFEGHSVKQESVVASQSVAITPPEDGDDVLLFLAGALALGVAVTFLRPAIAL